MLHTKIHLEILCVCLSKSIFHKTFALATYSAYISEKCIIRTLVIITEDFMKANNRNNCF